MPFSDRVSKEKTLLLRPPLRNINMTQFNTKIPEWKCFVVCYRHTDRCLGLVMIICCSKVEGDCLLLHPIKNAT